MLYRLFSQFILRRMAQERARTITTVVGIALGIAVVIAIQLTNASSVRGFETALNTVAGRTSVEILGTGGIDETTLPNLGWLREFGAMSPVIEGEMAIVTGPENRARRTETVKVLGVDILQDLTLRDYLLGARGEGSQPGGSQREGSVVDELTSQQFLELLTSPRAIVVTEKLARRRGYALGDEVRLMAGDRVNAFVIRGLLKDEGPAKVMDGSFVLMDIAAAQLAFDRLGRIDRLDVQLKGAGAAEDTPGSTEIDAALASIGARLPAGLKAQRPARRGEQVERMLAAFHLNLTALSWVGWLSGSSSFTTPSPSRSSPGARNRHAARAGVTRRVLGLFLGEAAVLAGGHARRHRPRSRDGRRGRRADALHGQRALPSPPRRLPRCRGGTSPWPSPSASRCRSSPRRCRPARRRGCRLPPPCAGAIAWNGACGCARVR
jgi:putative ABC transport system permease protein